MNKFIFVAMLVLCCSPMGYAQSFDDAYTAITPAQPTQTAGKIEVLEIFWYGCPHCYAFEPYLQQWLSRKPDNVEFRLMPGILNNNWVPHAKAYYVAEKLGILDKIHQQLFDAIHKDKRNIFSDDDVKEFFIKQGVDGNKFSEIYDSKELLEKLRQAFELQRGYQVNGVPAVIINGKYHTSPSMARSYDNLLKVMDYLVDKESEGSQDP